MFMPHPKKPRLSRVLVVVPVGIEAVWHDGRGKGVKKASGGRFCSCRPKTDEDGDDWALNTHASLPLPLATDTDNW
jgi:hypothetical protein